MNPKDLMILGTAGLIGWLLIRKASPATTAPAPKTAAKSGGTLARPTYNDPIFNQYAAWDLVPGWSSTDVQAATAATGYAPFMRDVWSGDPTYWLKVAR